MAILKQLKILREVSNFNINKSLCWKNSCIYVNFTSKCSSTSYSLKYLIDYCTEMTKWLTKILSSKFPIQCMSIFGQTIINYKILIVPHLAVKKIIL